MITDLLAKTVFHALQTTQQKDFFQKKAGARSKIMKEALPNDYPKPLLAYLETISEEGFVKDMDELLPMLGKKRSILSMGSAKQNGFVAAFAAGLKEQIQSDTDDASAKKRSNRILRREAQMLLMQVKGEESALVQLATDPDKATKEKLEEAFAEKGGIPQFIVSQELIGGLRLFSGGKLTDASWRAKVNQIFSKL